MTHSQIIDLWPSLTEFAGDISVQYGTAKAMRRRSRVPDEYWLVLVRRAEARGLQGVTLEALAEAVAVEQPPQANRGAAA